MKYLISAIALFLSFSVQANTVDRKVGNVIVVEREVPDIYSECVSRMTNSVGDISKPSRYFLCSFSILNENEISQTEKLFVRTKPTDKCSVEGDVKAGKIVILFGAQDQVASADQAKNCLTTALNGKNSLKVIVHTVE